MEPRRQKFSALAQQRVLTLIYVCDFTPAETARALSRTETSVRQLHKRGGHIA
jgi:DNA-directed RNA polymerase specialized sigma24 family protein